MSTPIQIGDNCPAFSLPDSKGNKVEINHFLGKKILVLFFYPKDNTPGCTKEACAFRDAYADFLDLGCEVFGISTDDSSSHQAFQEKHNLPYPLLADTQKKVRQFFGVPTSLFGLLPGRVTYVVGLDGKIAGIFNSQTNPVGHTNEALKVVRELLTV